MVTQMNVRIDADVKERGDRVFEKLGYTPSQVVRSVWQFAAENGETPAILAAALERPHAAAADLLADRRIADAQAGAGLFEAFRMRMCIPAADSLEEIDYDALRNEAFDARFAERSLA